MADNSEGATVISGFSALGKVGLTGMAFVMVTACGVLPEPQPVEQSVEQPERPPILSLGNDEVLSRLGSLSAQQVNAGECGLFLWAKRDDTPLVLFQRSNGDAFMRVDGVQMALARTSIEDQIALQFHRLQEFSVADMSIRVTVTPEETRTLQQGLKVPSGSIAISTESGWSASIPVAGAIGCQ